MDTAEEQQAHARMLRKVAEQNQLLEVAKQRMRALEAHHPHLALLPEQLGSSEGVADELHDLLPVGSGSFACVWATNKTFGPRNHHDELRDTEMWPDQQARGGGVGAGAGEKRKSGGLALSFASPKQQRSLSTAGRDQRQEHNDGRGTSSSSSYASVLKVLQLPMGTKQERFWGRQLLTRMADRSIAQLYEAFDELRWQCLFCKEAEAMVRASCQGWRMLAWAHSPLVCQLRLPARLNQQVACEGHPCIARCYGWCLEDSDLLPHLVMEYAGVCACVRRGVSACGGRCVCTLAAAEQALMR